MLETELRYLQSHRNELTEKYRGRFLVIKGDAVTGEFETNDLALQGAVQLHGLENVLIRRPEDADIELVAPALTFGLMNANA